MSAPELPDDPRHWPADPFALLGVERGAAETDIKRAYTRLIRRFKPEHAPEQFRRIREAYEACLDQFRWYFPRPDFPAPDEPPAAPVAPPPDSRAHAAELPRPTAVVDEAERLWAAAIDGREDEAYSGLVSLAAARPDRPDLPLRLYWLLAVSPALDAARTRHDWLADALRRSRLGGPATELYRRELEANPEAALFGPYLELLSVAASASELLTVARWRLAAAGRSRSWHPVGVDLDALAKRLPFEDEAGWLGHLVGLLDWVAWERPHALYTRGRAELDRLTHLELSRSYAFDRVEEVEHLTTGWQVILGQANTPGLLALLPAAWVGALSPAAVAAAAEEVAADPARAVRRLDRVAQGQGQGLLAVLARALEHERRSRGGDESEFPPDLIRGLAKRLPGGWLRGYDDLRGDLLAFLLDEAIHPFEFADACAGHPDSRVRAAADAVRNDLSLRIVWLATA